MPRRQRQPSVRKTCAPSNEGFGDYVTENMEALGLPAPDSIFKSIGLGVATLKSLQSAHAIFAGVSTSEIIAGGVVSATYGEGLTLAAGFSAAYYTGAFIGSLAIASQRSMSCGKRLADYFAMMPAAGFSDSEIREIKGIIERNPAITNVNLPNRELFAVRARVNPALLA